MEDIHQAEGEIGVGGEGREMEDGSNHGFGSSLMILLTIYINHPEAWNAVGGGGF